MLHLNNGLESESPGELRMQSLIPSKDEYSKEIQQTALGDLKEGKTDEFYKIRFGINGEDVTNEANSEENMTDETKTDIEPMLNKLESRIQDADEVNINMLADSAAQQIREIINSNKTEEKMDIE